MLHVRTQCTANASAVNREPRRSNPATKRQNKKTFAGAAGIRSGVTRGILGAALL